MSKADLHVHTSFSDGMASAQEVLYHVEAETDLDVLAITDHDDLKGAMLARELWANGNYRFDFVMGVEATAIEGHVVALFVEQPVPTLCPLVGVLEAVHRQGGICVIPHPLSRLTRSIDLGSIERVAALQGEGMHFDAIETANQSPAGRAGLRRAAVLNRERLRLAEVGGSDAHHLVCIGSAYTQFEGTTAADLKHCILERSTTGVCGTYPGFREIGAANVLRQSWRGLMTTPRRMGWRPTAHSFLRRIFLAR